MDSAAVRPSDPAEHLRSDSRPDSLCAGLKVDREGRILGKGHPRRDAVEWAIPVLWPIKLITLPMRGPRPTLKGETSVQLKLLEDVYVPVEPTAASLLMRSKPEQPESAAGLRDWFAKLRYAGAARRAGQEEPTTADRLIELYAQVPVAAPEMSNRGQASSTTYTLLVLNDRTVRVVTEYWFEDGHIFYLAPSGVEDSVAFSELDWKITHELNARRGVSFLVRLGREKAGN